MNATTGNNRNCAVGCFFLCLGLRYVVCRHIHGCVHALYLWDEMRVGTNDGTLDG